MTTCRRDFSWVLGALGIRTHYNGAFSVEKVDFVTS